MNIDKELGQLLAKTGIHPTLANILDELIVFIAFILLALFLNYICKKIFIPLIKRIALRTNYRFDDLLVERNVLTHVIQMIPALLIYMLVPMFFEEGRQIITLIRKVCVVYIIFSFLLALNGLILVIYEDYTLKRKDGHRPIRGFVQVIQVVLFFLGFIIIVSVIINRSPTALFAGLGASAAIFTLVFKDLITGFIAGVQLSMNDMVRPGDWITLPDNKTDGIVQEITLITVKIKNFDNSISTVPPTILVTNTFKNWREMLESNGRLAARSIFVASTSVVFATPEMISTLQQKYPELTAGLPDNIAAPTNSDLFRKYMEQYLLKRKDINHDMGLKVGELESTDRGLPILLYFFTRNKDDRSFERIQAEVFDHAMAVLPGFGLTVK